MAGKPKGPRCDRCGGKAVIVAKAPSDYDKRRIYLCHTHQTEHEEALKTQKFNVESIKEALIEA